MDRELAPGGEADTHQGGAPPDTSSAAEATAGGKVVPSGEQAPPAPGGGHPERDPRPGSTRGEARTEQETRGSSTALNCSFAGTTSCIPDGGGQHPSQLTRHATLKQPARGQPEPPPERAAAGRPTSRTSSTATTYPVGPTHLQSPPSPRKKQSHRTLPKHRPTTPTGTHASQRDSVAPRQRKHAEPSSKAKGRGPEPDQAAAATQHHKNRPSKHTPGKRPLRQPGLEAATIQSHHHDIHTPNPGKTPGSSPLTTRLHHTARMTTSPTPPSRHLPQTRPKTQPASRPRRGKQHTNSAAESPRTRGGKENTENAKLRPPAMTGGDPPVDTTKPQRQGGNNNNSGATATEGATHRAHQPATSKQQQQQRQAGRRRPNSGPNTTPTPATHSRHNTGSQQHGKTTTATPTGQEGTHRHMPTTIPGTRPLPGEAGSTSHGRTTTMIQHKRGAPRRHSKAVAAAATCRWGGSSGRFTQTHSGMGALCGSAQDPEGKATPTLRPGCTKSEMEEGSAGRGDPHHKRNPHHNRLLHRAPHLLHTPSTPTSCNATAALQQPNRHCKQPTGGGKPKPWPCNSRSNSSTTWQNMWGESRGLLL